MPMRVLNGLTGTKRAAFFKGCFFVFSYLERSWFFCLIFRRKIRQYEQKTQAIFEEKCLIILCAARADFIAQEQPKSLPNDCPRIAPKSLI
jgi:hypothetical protein